MHFQLFLPDKFGANPDHLAQVGLAGLVRPGDRQPHFADVPHGGPGVSGAGQFVRWLTDGPQDLTYAPESQVWVPNAKPMDEAPRYLVGWNRAAPPTTADLQRNSLVLGPILTLGDGQDWVIPNVRNVPHSMRLTAEGWQPVPKPEFDRLVQRAQWAFDVARKSLNGLDAGSYVAATEFALEALAWNYRIVPELASALGLFDVRLLVGLMALTTDYERLMQIEGQVSQGEAAATPSG